MDDDFHSVAEVEVVISVAVVLALSEAPSDEVERERQERDSAPDAEAEVDNPSLDEEALDASVEPVEEPLLSCVGAVVENITSRK